MKKSQTPSKPTFETVWTALQETDRFIKEEAKEWRKAMKVSHIESKEWRKEMKNMNRDISGIGKSNGEVAESFFISCFDKKLEFANQKYDSYSPNLEKKYPASNLKEEYDLVLYNCNSVAIIEIKYKARKEDLEQLLKKARTFKVLFPEFQNFAIYLGLAGLHVNKTAEIEAKKLGVAIIKQVGKSSVVFDENIKVY